MIRTVAERCQTEEQTDEVTGETSVDYTGRKDLIEILVCVDLNAALANFSNKKGDHQYKVDSKMYNELQTIVARATLARDRLHAMGIAPTDKCDHPECEGTRHTTQHMFWECEYYQGTIAKNGQPCW